MKIATWNINSVRLRLPLVTRFLETERPDVLCLQETKTVNETFPAAAFRALGYGHQHIRGMKSYNGVAILSRLPFCETGGKDWVGKKDCRHAFVLLENGIEINNFYVPAGGDIPDPHINEKFAHKLDFVDAMARWLKREKASAQKLVLLGDLNIAPLEQDVWSHKQLLDVVSHTEVEVKKLTAMQQTVGFVDALRHFVPPEKKLYSWWSYRAADWEKSDRGRRLDHIWVTPDLAPHLRSGHILKAARGWDPKPSDHVPVLIELADQN